MSVFKKRDTLTENISYMGMMAAINVVFVLLTTLLPYLLFLIVFVLPLTNCIVTLFCKKKYYPIYAIATAALCMIVTVWNISDTLFYVIPSLITGFLFGVLIENKVQPIFIILATSMLQVGLSYAFVPLTKLITGVDIISVFATVFKVNDHPYLSTISLLFITFLSVTQSVFTYLVIKEEINKLGFEIKLEVNKKWLVGTINIVLLALCLIFGFIFQPLCYFFLMFSLIISVYEFIDIIVSKNRLSIILIFISLAFSFFIFAISYQKVPSPMGLSLIGTSFLLVTIIGFINNYLCIDKSKVKIK